LKSLWRFTPRLGPEWGSGGIFGLRYHKGALYFNLAFEAEAHFIRGDDVKVYDYSLVGPGPASGGDTYNAVCAVDDRIFFAGWVHAPAVISREDGILHFYNKYSHVHCYDLNEDRVSLLWKEGIGHKMEWAGEVSEVIYNDLNQELLLARADGHRSLGIFGLSPSGGQVKQLSEAPGLHGTMFMDHAAFNTGGVFMNGIQLIDLNNHGVKKTELDLSGGISLDGGAVAATFVGSMSSTVGRLFSFVRGGVFFGDPLSNAEEDRLRFVRLFDFPGYQCSPYRANSLPVGGGILTAYSSLPDVLGYEHQPIAMPSVLVYVTPPSVRVVGAFGCRITSLETMSSDLLVATNTMPNVSNYKTTALDTGHRDIMSMSLDVINKRPPTMDLALSARDFGTSHWGGIPLCGYREASMIVQSSRDNTIESFEYDLSVPPASAAWKESFRLTRGKTKLDLSSFRGIVSFRLSQPDPSARVSIRLG